MAKKTDPRKIREKAYELWEQEGRPEGRHEQHWSEAEASMTKRKAASKKTDAKAKADPKAARKARKTRAKTDA